ncbi:MAG: hypothetical protein CVV24_14405 [Ignavibacteriae bacterium HGW-Ignavibacteriae-3]|nr:MAG: hypothetical protein CVV24_14405 [Ignavibacteriae bacterium HGW-Ignavibacteriae-3]
MKNFIAFIIVFILGITALKAQSVAIGPQVGFIKSADADKATIMPGVALRINILGLGLEGSMYYKSEEFQNGAIKTKSYPINLTAMLSILPIVHAEAGIGWYNTQIDFTNLNSTYTSIRSETQSKAGYHFGAGIALPVGNLLLTGDIRYVFLDLSTAVNFKSNFSVLMVGAMFKL